MLPDLHKSAADMLAAMRANPEAVTVDALMKLVTIQCEALDAFAAFVNEHYPACLESVAIARARLDKLERREPSEN